MRYILNADDFGRTKTVNQAIVYGFDHCYLDRTSIMVNMPYFEEAVQIAKTHDIMDKVGLHINLTSGEPLSEPIKEIKSFCDENGKFNGKIFIDRRLMLFLTVKEKVAVKNEICAQIEKYLQYDFRLLHADSHGHVHTFPSLQNVILKSLKYYGFKSVRISANLHSTGLAKYRKWILNRKLIQYNNLQGDETEYFDSFKRVLLKFRESDMIESVCEVMLHPNIFDGDMQIGEGLHYEDLQNLKNTMNNNQI